MLDFETLVISLRLSWLTRLYSGEAVGWKCYLEHLSKPYMGVFLFHCDNDSKDYYFSDNFYSELIRFWADFRNAFPEMDSRRSIVWNNKDVRIDGQPVFYERFFGRKMSFQLGH